MNDKRIGIDVSGDDPNLVVSTIQKLEQMGIPAAWLITDATSIDGLTVLAVAAAQTERILLGTSITPTWPRHPITAVGQVQTIAKIAPGRFRFGVGPGHRIEMADVFGFDFKAPLTNLREYLRIVRSLLHQGEVDHEGRYYDAHMSIAQTYPDVPVLASALRKASFHLCGAESDGAISWVCPGRYLHEVAIPAMEAGAKEAGRQVPPLYIHAPVCVHDDADEVREAVRQELADYPKLPFYANMFADAGFPEALETGGWSDDMVDAVVLSGSEETVKNRLKELFDWGASEVLATVVTAGGDQAASWERTVSLIAEISRS